MLGISLTMGCNRSNLIGGFAKHFTPEISPISSAAEFLEKRVAPSHALCPVFF
jgi:hypothetical protein